MGLGNSDNSIDGDLYVLRLASYVKQNEANLANGLLFFSKKKTKQRSKPLRLNFTLHHLYYIAERIESLSLGVDVGPLNITLENPNHEPTFISFMANNAKSLRNFESDTRSISSINSMRSIVLTASMYWRGFSMNRDPKVIQKDIRYLYSSFTKIPCLIVSPQTKINSIADYEEYPCDTAVPLLMFKNLQVLEICDYDPNELFGWDLLSEKLRILTIRNSRIDDLGQLLFNLVIEDSCGRSSTIKRRAQDDSSLSQYKAPTRQRASTTAAMSSGSGSLPKDLKFEGRFLLSPTSSTDYHTLPDRKWELLKQLSVTETSIKSIDPYVFKPLANLVKINLSNNLLEAIPLGLDQLANLRYLNLANNFITNLANIPHNLTQLTTLNLHNNQITNLDGLELMPSLASVDLRKNKLQEITDLKPLISHFLNFPQSTFDNVCLMANPLPKGYRIEVFNLLNGIRWKNTVKIDDSRPGYFESALLLDADASNQKLAQFMGIDPKSNRNSSQLVSSLNGGSFETLREELNKILHPLLQSDKQHRRIYDLSQSVAHSPPPPSLALPATVTLVDAGSIASSSTFQIPTSPLSPNQNLTNQLATDYISTKHQMSIATRSLPSETIRKSSTQSQLDSEANSSAPSVSVVTPVQVTARMST